MVLVPGELQVLMLLRVQQGPLAGSMVYSTRVPVTQSVMVVMVL